jgi:hypothetical protein
MKKIKYYYNTNTLRYEKLETPLRVTLLRILGFISASSVTALILVSLAYRYFPSANEKRLMQTNEALKDNYFVLNEQAKKMQEQIAQDRPYIMIDYENWTSAWSSKWTGFVPDAMGIFGQLSTASLTNVHQVG